MPRFSDTLRQSGRIAALGSLALCLVLGGCGEDDDDDDLDADGNDETAVTTNLIDSSPAANFAEGAGVPQDANSATVTLENGELDPDTIEAQSGRPFILIVEGDGAEHTLAIENLVSEWAIEAEGPTEVTFSITEDVRGDFPITIDGEEVGTFVVQAPGGIVDD